MYTSHNKQHASNTRKTAKERRSAYQAPMKNNDMVSANRKEERKGTVSSSSGWRDGTASNEKRMILLFYYYDSQKPMTFAKERVDLLAAHVLLGSETWSVSPTKESI